MDGTSVPYEMSWQRRERFRVVKIGDPNRTLQSGPHIFVIRYSIPGVLDPASTGADAEFAGSTNGKAIDPRSMFFWNVVAPGWENTIDRATITVSLPGAITSAQCAKGWGVGRPCDRLEIEGSTLTVTASKLAPRTPATVRVGVDIATPPRAELPWAASWNRVLGTAMPAVLWMAALTVLAVALAALLYRFFFEKPPPYPLQYAPPEGIGLVQAEYLRTELVCENALTATFFHLAEQGLVELRQTAQLDWCVQGIGDRQGWLQADQVGIAVGRALDIMSRGDSFTADDSVSAGRKLTEAKLGVAAAAQRWAFGQGLVENRGVVPWLRLVSVIAGACAVLATFRAFYGATTWVIPLGVFFTATVLVWHRDVTTYRTTAGRELWSQVGGFHRMLVTESAEARFDFAARKDLYTAYLPYAMAAGAADRWASKYRDETGYVPPQPQWYFPTESHRQSTPLYTSSGSSAPRASSSTLLGGTSFDSFESSLSSSIGAYTESLRAASDSDSESAWGGWGGGGGGGSW